MAGRKETVDDVTILEYIDSHDDPVVTTSEVADFLDFSNSGTIKRLYSLDEDGYLGYKDAGRTHVWWITDEGQAYLNENSQ